MQNIFSFDSFSDEVTKAIFEVFHRYGIFVGKISDKHGKVELAPNTELPEVEILGTLWLSDSLLNETKLNFEKSVASLSIQRIYTKRQKWEILERVATRGAVFSEELFHFFLKCDGSILATASSTKFLHVLTAHLDLYTYLSTILRLNFLLIFARFDFSGQKITYLLTNLRKLDSLHKYDLSSLTHIY